MAIQTQSFRSTQPIQPIQAITIDARYLRAKRLLDILFTLLILLPLGIVIAIVVIFIRIDSVGPIFFRQQRVGRNGVPFEILKFRSMYTNSDDALHRAAIARYLNDQQIQSSGEGTLSYKQTNDPRITRVGRFIRKTSIDELPQFFNVLRGEMTLVGPRPPLPFEVEHYSPKDMLRLSGTPGLTGTWQVYGRSRVPFHSMVEMDIEYLQHPSLRKDLKLIALTVPVMIQGRGGA
jgi:lipopolysaccharide/colanic/teichoic acid biosynthesis glycosyltransferase